MDLPSFRPRQSLLAEDLNKIVNAVIQRVGGGKGIQAANFGGNVLVSKSFERRPPTVLRQMEIQSVQGDYLVCRTLDASGTQGPNDVYVLKPWTLRQTPFDGQTVNGVSYAYSDASNRTATAGDEEEDQQITQDYYTGAVIYVMDSDASVEVVAGVFARVIDVNVDARAWLKVPEE